MNKEIVEIINGDDTAENKTTNILYTLKLKLDDAVEYMTGLMEEEEMTGMDAVYSMRNTLTDMLDGDWNGGNE
nr:MAG TPA: hypothetical protein [Caudoviricetes sp.]